MLTLYSMQGTCALAVHISLEWAQIPYQLNLLNSDDNHQLEYLQVNPLGSVPAMELPDGSVLTEASALLTYIDAERPNRFAAPSRDSLGKARLAETLSFFTTELHAAFAPHFAPARFHPDKAEHATLKSQAYTRLQRLFDFTDDSMIGPYVFGLDRSVADPYLYVLTRWIAGTPLSLDSFPLLSGFKDRMEMDNSVRKVLKSYDINVMA